MDDTLLIRVKQYIIKSNNITEEEYSNNIREYLKQTFKNLKCSNNILLKYRLKRKQLREDIADLECSMVGSENFNCSEEGKNTGGKKNPPDFKMIQKLRLKEELGQLLNESLLLEKSLKENNELMLEFIKLLPNKNQQIVLELTYIDGLSNGRIANQLYYSVDSVDKYRNRGIKKLASFFE